MRRDSTRIPRRLGMVRPRGDRALPPLSTWGRNTASYRSSPSHRRTESPPTSPGAVVAVVARAATPRLRRACCAHHDIDSSANRATNLARSIVRDVRAARWSAPPPPSSRISSSIISSSSSKSSQSSSTFPPAADARGIRDGRDDDAMRGRKDLPTFGRRWDHASHAGWTHVIAVRRERNASTMRSVTSFTRSFSRGGTVPFPPAAVNDDDERDDPTPRSHSSLVPIVVPIPFPNPHNTTSLKRRTTFHVA